MEMMDMSESKDVIYTCLDFELPTERTLALWMADIGGEIRGWGNHHGKHVTLQFRPTEAQVANLPEGRHVGLRVVSFISDENCQAFGVEILDPEVKALCENEQPHITMWTSRHVSPVYSNGLFERSVGAKECSEEAHIEGLWKHLGQTEVCYFDIDGPLIQGMVTTVKKDKR